MPPRDAFVVQHQSAARIAADLDAVADADLFADPRVFVGGDDAQEEQPARDADPLC
jgi:hypothetical protein